MLSDADILSMEPILDENTLYYIHKYLQYYDKERFYVFFYKLPINRLQQDLLSFTTVIHNGDKKRLVRLGLPVMFQLNNTNFHLKIDDKYGQKP